MEGREPCPAVPYTYTRNKRFARHLFPMQMYDKNTLQRIIRWLNNLIGGDFETKAPFFSGRIKTKFLILGQNKVIRMLVCLHIQLVAFEYVREVREPLFNVPCSRKPRPDNHGVVFPIRNFHRISGEKEEVRRVDVEPGLLPLLAIQYLSYQMVEPHQVVCHHVQGYAFIPRYPVIRFEMLVIGDVSGYGRQTLPCRH